VVGDLIAGTRFLVTLPAFLRRPLTPAEAHAILRERLDRRAADFLSLMRTAVYDHPPSPYRSLLRVAGCQFGDLEDLVRREGVEGALGALYRAGVYLTVDEFKGRRVLVRGGERIESSPERLRNPRSAFHVPVRSSGTRGAGTAVPIDLSFIRDDAVDRLLFLAAEGETRAVHAVWGIPGSAAIGHILRFAACGLTMARWFSQVAPGAAGLHPRYRWSPRVLRWGGRLGGMALPRPEHVSLEAPLPIAAWMASVLARGDVPRLMTYAGSAVRLCQVAHAAGVDLVGARLEMSGEPVTSARVAAVRRNGVTASVHYGSSEVGCHIAYGCLRPQASDDLHLLHDMLAVIQPGTAAGDHGLPARALLFSSLRTSTPFVLLNVSIGDAADVDQRACGCALGAFGWATHLRNVRSFEKLTAGGMNFLDVDAIRILEEDLPARCGGGPGDYQLVEQEDENGESLMRLLVRPDIGAEPDEVHRVFLAAVGQGPGVGPAIAALWRDAGLLRVEQRPPLSTTAGKILHLHRLRRDQAGSAVHAPAP
jgi:hypothetical protein